MRNPYTLAEGVVLRNDDPQQEGRLKIWVASVDGENPNIENLPWASYVSVLGGQTRNYPAGATGMETPGLQSYGFWAIPKVGAIVIVGFLYGDFNQRIYMGSTWRKHGNRSLPTGRNRSDITDVPVSDTLDPVEPQTTNMLLQFDGKTEAPEARTRGAYERSIAQDKNVKDGKEGYQAAASGGNLLDPQTYCLTTPGRHSLIFQDHPTNSRTRLKTAEGHQIIFDDANERIYISTAEGRNYIELDQDGRIHIYAADDVSLSTGGNLNLTAEKSINMRSGKNINISATGNIRLSACEDVSLTGDGSVNLSSDGSINFNTLGNLLQTASEIHLNGPKAPTAPFATLPTVTPLHEPWERPASKTQRNKNWKK